MLYMIGVYVISFIVCTVCNYGEQDGCGYADNGNLPLIMQPQPYPLYFVDSSRCSAR